VPDHLASDFRFRATTTSQINVRPIMPSCADDPTLDTPRSSQNHNYVSR
jgi:hypothetical protein